MKLTMCFHHVVTQMCLAEKINEWAATNWSLYARDQYFDSEGYFIAIVFIFPIMALCVCILINWFLTLMNLMAFVKRQQLVAEAARKRRSEAEKAKQPVEQNATEATADSQGAVSTKEKSE